MLIEDQGHLCVVPLYHYNFYPFVPFLNGIDHAWQFLRHPSPESKIPTLQYRSLTWTIPCCPVSEVTSCVLVALVELQRRRATQRSIWSFYVPSLITGVPNAWTCPIRLHDMSPETLNGEGS